LFVSDTFYWIQSELPQGLALIVVLFAIASSQKNNVRPFSLGLIIPGLFAVGFAHPLLLFPTMFLLVFFFFKKEIIERRMIYAMAFFYLVILFLKNTAFKTQYESQAMDGTDNFARFFPNYLDIYSNKHFLKNCAVKYYWVPVISIGIAVVYVLKKQFAKLLLFIGFLIAYLLLINVSYPDPATQDFYLENLYLPISVFIAVPLIFDIFPSLNSQRLAVFTISLIVISGLFRIYLNHKPYTNRLNWERHFLARHINEKIIVSDKKIPLDTLLMTWGTPYEFWLLSTIETGKTASIIISDHPDGLVWATDKNQSFLTTWGAYPYNELPGQYFNFKDTISKYKIIR